MDDMTAFDRHISTEVLREVGPSEQVDDLAIFTAITTASQSPKWRFQSMFSAAKFVVAGAIVALFGGFLLSGVLTQPSDETVPAATTDSPSPMTTEELLSMLVTDEVEPGVYRVLDDGAGHDLVAEPAAAVTIAPDGSVWLLRAPAQERFQVVDALFELGQDGTYPFEPSGDPGGWLDVDVAVDVDGVAWLGIEPEFQDGRAPHGTLSAFDGTTWATPTWPDGSGDVGAIEATSSGAVWIARDVEDGPGPSVARIEGGEWTELPTLDDPSLEGHFRGQFANFVAAADGTAWLANGRITGGNDGDRGPKGLLHFDGERWDVVDLPIDGESLHAGPLALGPDGTLWVYVTNTSDTTRITHHLARLDAGGWSVFSGRSGPFGRNLSEADGVPLLTTQIYYEARMAVDRDGRLWIAIGGDGGLGSDTFNPALPYTLGSSPGPVGVPTFDGTTWNQYLKGLHVNRVDVTDDGTVFATALYGCPTGVCNPYKASGNADWSLGGLYVITPEAVAATE